MTNIEYSYDMYNIGGCKIDYRGDDKKNRVERKENIFDDPTIIVEVEYEDVKWNRETGRFEPVRSFELHESLDQHIEFEKEEIYDDDIYFDRETGRFEPVMKVTRRLDRVR